MNQFSPDTSLSLLHRVRQESPGAWEQLTDVYGPLVYRWIRRRGLRAADARDVTQDVWLTVHKNLNRFRHGRKGAFRRWLRRITASRVADYVRSRAGPEAEGGSSATQALQQLAAPRGPATTTEANTANEEAEELLALVKWALEHLQASR